MNTIDFSTPGTTISGLKQFQLDVKRRIEEAIIELLEANGGTVMMTEDSRVGFPHIYSDDAHCTIQELKRVSVNRTGKWVGRVYLTTDSYSRPAQPHCESLTEGELLQVWDLVIKQVNK